MYYIAKKPTQLYVPSFNQYAIVSLPQPLSLPLFISITALITYISDNIHQNF